MGRLARVIILVLLLSPLSAAGGETSPLTIRIDGKILRKGSGRLVFSLSAFELDGAKDVVLANRASGEKRTVALSSVYDDSCYSETIDPEWFDRIDAAQWAPFVVWTVADTVGALSARLEAVHEYQNAVRLALGKAFLEEGAGGTPVSPRVSLNKLEKFNRVGAVIARALLAKGAGPEPFNPFRRPIRIQSSFSPFSAPSAGASADPVEQIREVLFWDAHRTLTQQMGVADDIVEMVFDSPGTIREFTPVGDAGREGRASFAPTVVIPPESIDAAMYIARQGIAPQIRELLRTRRFRDGFIGDRPVVDAFVNRGTVVGVAGRRIAVSFIPPFMAVGETVRIVDEGAGVEIPVVLASPVPGGGYTMTGDLPDVAVAQVRAGMTVRRR